MSWLAADDGDLERRRFNDAAFDLWRGRPDQDLTPPKDICRDALAIINYSAVEKLGREPAAFERRRIAVRASNGYDNMDLAGWAARGIPVCDVPDYGATEVADHAIAPMLALTRGIISY
jgi:D-3-phosphoglycerate dehydrogenase/C-terminal binding protein